MMEGMKRTDASMTMIFANPRSGSTLLMRLLNHACMTRCIGDKREALLEAICNLYKHRKTDDTLYQPALYDSKVFPDEYSGFENEDRLDRKYLEIVKMSLFSQWYSHGYMKTTVPGFNNDLVHGFAPIIDAFKENHDFTLVVLQRPAEEVAESFITSPGGPLYKMEDKREMIIDAINNQNKAFKEIMDFDTVMVTYEQLCKDPMQILQWCKPVYSPNKVIVDREMGRRIR